jgi:hypothetical protein
MAQLATFLMALQADANWNETDVKLVQIGAIRMLKLMVRRTESGEFESLLEAKSVEASADVAAH